MKLEHGGNIIEIARKYNINPDEIIDFSNNINPFGAPPDLIEILKNQIHQIKIFPELYAERLCKIAGSFYNYSADNFIFGNGSSQLIYLFFSNIVQKQSSILLMLPNYSDYSYIIDINKLRYNCDEINTVSENKNNRGQELADLIDVKLKLKKFDYLILTNPNNPLGYFIELNDLKILLKKNRRTIFVIDESYIDFMSSKYFGKNISVLNIINENDNLIVFKSLTKILAVPGLRAGFAAANKKLITKMKEFLPPWSVNSLAELACEYYFHNNNELVNNTGNYIYKANKEISAELRKIRKLKIIKSRCNFMTVSINEYQKLDSLKLQRILLKKHKILIRDCSNIGGLFERYFRFSIKKPDENKLLIAALKNIFC